MKVSTAALKTLRQYGTAIGLALLTTLGLWLLRDVMTLANFSLVYLLVVLLTALRQGIGPSLVAALITFLCFNFFLVRPLYTFLVADPREVLDLVIFFVVAVLTGQTAARARAAAEKARQRANERDLLYKVTSNFNQVTTDQAVYETLRHVLTDDLGACQVDILPEGGQREMLADSLVAYHLMEANNHIYGTLRVVFDAPISDRQSRLVNTCVAQAAMALHRIRLMEQARRSETFEEADRLKTALLHAVSHDLRTPITIIKTSASNLLHLYLSLPDDERAEILNAIDTEADHLDRMVGNLLDLSRLKAGAVKLNRRLNTLEEVAGDVAARVFKSIHHERIQLIFPDDMPLVSFDYGLILQALTNLVDNALRYEPEGRKVIIQGSFNGGEARVAVINHGPTVQPEEKEQLMEPFYHGKEGHVGLGLPIARGITEAHHGRLWLEDTAGGGATFILALPVETEMTTLESAGS